jgi:MFS family permease
MARSKWYTLTIICLAQILCVSDNAIMFNSLSSLVISFHSHVAAMQLANTIYPLIAGALMLSGGLLGLKIGWKKLLCIGLLILVVGETAATLSPNVLFFTWGARVLAGLGASLTIPAVIGLIPATYQGKDLVIGFGAIGAAVGVASILGPIGGGWLIDSFGWRVAFLVLAISICIVFLAALRIEKKTQQKINVKFDFLGTILFVPSMILITIGLTKIGIWSFEKIIPCVTIGIIILALFVVYEFKLEKKREIVLFPSIFLKSKQARDGLVMTAMIFFISGGMSFALTTYLQVVLGYNALITGLVLAVNALGIILFSIGTPLVVENINPRIACQISVLLVFASGLLIAFGIDPSALCVLFFVGIFMAGTAVGLLSSQAGVIVTSSISGDYAAQSGGIQGSMRNIGQAIGITFIGIVMVHALTLSVKGNAVKDPAIQIQTKHSIQLMKSVSFVTNKQLEKYLSKAHLSEKAKNNIIYVNSKSRLKALRVTFISFAVISLLFMFFTFKLPVSFDNRTTGEP